MREQSYDGENEGESEDQRLVGLVAGGIITMVAFHIGLL